MYLSNIVSSGTSAFFENPTQVTDNYTVTTNKNAGTFGPITIADNKTVTIPDGSVWHII